MKYGYVRKGISTPNTDAEEQFKKEYGRLVELGVQTIVSDCFDESKRERPNLNKLVGLDIKAGDILYVTRLGFFEDSLSRVMLIVDEILKKGASLYLDDVGLIDLKSGSELYRLMVKLSQEERNMGIEKNYEGKAIARSREGFKDGRPKEIPADLMDRAMEMLKGKREMKDVIKLTGISRSSLTREVKKRKIKIK